MGTIGSTKSPPGWFKGPSDAPKSSTPPTRICHLAKSGTIWVKMLPMRRHGELFSEMVLWPTPNGGSGALGCSTQPRPCTDLSPGPKTTSAREAGPNAADPAAIGRKSQISTRRNHNNPQTRQRGRKRAPAPKGRHNYMFKPPQPSRAPTNQHVGTSPSNDMCMYGIVL